MHNRVQDIERVANIVRQLVPDARVAVAHGQMDEGSLEQVILDFSDGRFDVLVCTTIIESGIDMPTVNTLVVDRADLLGLGQLHQLRGRVGRADQRAYAYLLLPPDRVLTEQAYERLKTIGEHTELGSGFKIAMRDLEIRGAGNLLGTDQSGHIAAVGYDLYVRMVAEAVAELKGEPIRLPAEIKVELPVRRTLPEPTSAGRTSASRLTAGWRRCASRRRSRNLRTEWVDRYGAPPAPAEALLAIGLLRAECVRTGVTEVTAAPSRVGVGGLGRPGEVVARLSPVKLPVSSEVRLKRLHPRAILKGEEGAAHRAAAGRRRHRPTARRPAEGPFAAGDHYHRRIVKRLRGRSRGVRGLTGMLGLVAVVGMALGTTGCTLKLAALCGPGRQHSHITGLARRGDVGSEGRPWLCLPGIRFDVPGGRSGRAHI